MFISQICTVTGRDPALCGVLRFSSFRVINNLQYDASILYKTSESRKQNCDVDLCWSFILRSYTDKNIYIFCKYTEF